MITSIEHERGFFSHTENVINQTQSGIYALTGPAGSGKSYTGFYLAKKHSLALYSVDYRFIGDSHDRLILLNKKQAKTFEDYRDSANQFNWWDWSLITRDINTLLCGETVSIDSAYCRVSGKKNENIIIPPSKKILYEGAILGPPALINKFIKIIFIVTPQLVRFDRITAKDKGRRDFNEILARFLITEYSENIYYRNLFDWAGEKLVFIDSQSGRPCQKPQLQKKLFLPIQV